MASTQDIHVRGTVPLVSPVDLKKQLPASDESIDCVLNSRQMVGKILSGEDQRLMLIVGPCSIHDEKAALEYADRLAKLAQELSDTLLIIMRVYFEKPRTTVGWKGLINDPHMNGTFDIEQGLRRARTLLIQTTEMQLPTATEMLDPITPQYTADLVSWASIGARTTESQTHRQMASGLSMPVGYKNATDGNPAIAIQAMQSSQSPHSFLGIDEQGQTCIINTTGNSLAHLILRGGRSGPNFSAEHVEKAGQAMIDAGLKPNIVVDCSHANSNKDHEQQIPAFRDVLKQRVAGNTHIIGMMLESHLCAGNQSLGDDPSALEYGISITDACLDWEQTEVLLREADAAMSQVLGQSASAT
ncbi:Phospho-2-dehydro-3-deoxyheptonate aldolase, Tyr-sensitive [Symmachiella dynata]|uniref:Phospho-2-dehydro-3-deoxyheptonate aldolase n=1 Tax=Symmachiella dynata TaxID=2527995 RepID=A0A517ZTD5_9PLAN|nr:3-deoxy-7-phosphoheptulonate synthase [Symmachiella dynata]QDU45720.1 Phospho-2-dehydro-3-deoxyheptonate aldolase, Tyr-sensitive [Symmachiella dynata]